FKVTGFPSLISPAVPGQLTVTAEDNAGNVITGYTGTVHFASPDAAAVLAADYTFEAADQGVHTFTAKLNTAATQQISVQDTTLGISGVDNNIVVHSTPVSVIPVANHRGLVFDPLRGFLYITT